MLRGGRVIDPSQDLDAIVDIAFTDGRITALGDAGTRARTVLDVSGRIVTPGWIDIHGHYFVGGHPISVEPDDVCPPAGVTTAVDQGSTGWGNFGAFRDGVIRRCRTRVFAFIHLSGAGMIAPLTSDVGELMDLSYARIDEAVACVRANPDDVRGIKLRMDRTATGEANALPALELARELADAAKRPLMVHVSGSTVPLATIAEHLRAGDLMTHAFHSTGPHRLIDDSGRVHRELWQARDRGVLFDVGCASVPDPKVHPPVHHPFIHFEEFIAAAAAAENFWPHTFSTDRHLPRAGRRSPDMPEVMTTFLRLGMPFTAAVAAATSSPADVLGLRRELGTLRAGSLGDATVFNLADASDGVTVEVVGTVLRGAPQDHLLDGLSD